MACGRRSPIREIRPDILRCVLLEGEGSGGGRFPKAQLTCKTVDTWHLAGTVAAESGTSHDACTSPFRAAWKSIKTENTSERHCKSQQIPFWLERLTQQDMRLSRVNGLGSHQVFRALTAMSVQRLGRFQTKILEERMWFLSFLGFRRCVSVTVALLK